VSCRDAAAGFAAALAAAVRDPRAVLFGLLAVSFALLCSVLHRTALRRRFAGDLAPTLLYFACFFLLLFAAPLAWVLAAGRGAGLTPASLGLAAGDWRLGLALCAVGTPLVVFAAFIGSRDPALRAVYPFSRDTLDRPGAFALHEAAYALLYYPAWEFAFRGVLLLGLAAMLPAGPAGLAAAVMVQAMLSTVYHLGHPASEVIGAAVFGVVFGVIAAATGSILYPLYLHALVGVLDDLFIRRAHRRDAGRPGRRSADRATP
jgi:membrane protease YdiL (CAAX protease family)